MGEERQFSPDQIQAGTFHADDKRPKGEQAVAVRLIKAMGSRLVSEHPEIAEMYKDPSVRLIDIAKKVFPPEEVEQFPDIYGKAVGWAIRKLNPAVVQNELTQQHRRHIGKLIFNPDKPGFAEQCKEAARVRHELHGVDAEAMVRGRGREPWTLAERNLIEDLMTDPNFQHHGGAINGTPNYEKIAQELNRLFHDSKEVRTSNSVGSLVRDWRRKK